MDLNNKEFDQATETISTLSQHIWEILDTLYTQIKQNGAPKVHRTNSDLISLIDHENGRFKVWAKNIGAIQATNSKRSLDARLKDATEMKMAVMGNLRRLRKSVTRASAIVAAEIPNRVAHKSNDDGTQGQTQVTELDKLLLGISLSIKQLMRQSMLIRRQRPRGRMPNMENLPKVDPQLDIRHVKDKFPKVKKFPWLADRLGTCISRRREIIQYRQLHSDRLAQRHEEVIGDTVLEATPSTIATTYEDSSGHAGLDASKMSMRASFRTTATSFATTAMDDNGDLHVPSLSDIIFHGVALDYNEEFECPYCRTIQDITSPQDWKRHVFADLQPYVCTFEDCSTEMYGARHEWIDHETEAHRNQWYCNQCDAKAFPSKSQFTTHLDRNHPGSVTEAQFPLIANMCKQVVDRFDYGSCLLCDEWTPSSDMSANGLEFFRHLGMHLQEISLSSLPQFIEGMEIRDAAVILPPEDPPLRDDTSSTSSQLPEPPTAPPEHLNPFEDSQGRLPAGWERREDHLGRTYYVDHNTRTTTWNRPQVISPASLVDYTSVISLQEPETLGTPPKRLGPFEDSQGRLPAGWERREDNLGRTYYVDHNSRKTSWNRP